jgi:hypothetical protein
MPVDRNASREARTRRAIGRLARTGLAHLHIDAEIPIGTVDSANKAFTLAHAPAGQSLQLFKNGLLQTADASADYTLSGAAITFADDNVPQTGDRIIAWYRIDQ